MSLRLRAPITLLSRTEMCSRLQHVLQVGMHGNCDEDRAQILGHAENPPTLTQIEFTDGSVNIRIGEGDSLSSIYAAIQDCWHVMNSPTPCEKAIERGVKRFIYRSMNSSVRTTKVVYDKSVEGTIKHRGFRTGWTEEAKTFNVDFLVSITAYPSFYKDRAIEVYVRLRGDTGRNKLEGILSYSEMPSSSLTASREVDESAFADSDSDDCTLPSLRPSLSFHNSGDSDDGF